jgi:hypothetical protein
MRQIPFGSSAVPLKLEYPAEWDPKLVTGVTLTVLDRDGDELMAADSATVYTQTTLNADVDAFASSIVLDSGADDLEIGESLLIEGILGDEFARVKGYDTATQTAELESILENEHDSGENVWGRFCDYSLDVSTTTTYTAGILLTLLWTPTGSGGPITQQVQVAKSALDLSGLELTFSRIYPRAYKALTSTVGRFNDVSDEAERQVTFELMAEGFDIQRLIDTDSMMGPIMAKMAWLWVLNGDDNTEDERRVISGEYDTQMSMLKAAHLWVDHDQDRIEDDGEASSRERYYERTW